MTFNPDTYLQNVGALPDAEIDLAEAALALAMLMQRDARVEKYQNHLRKLCAEVAKNYAQALVDVSTGGAVLQLEILRQVLCDAHGYTGDSEDYDNIQNASLIRLIDRGRGLPIALAVLYIHVARAQGWDICGLNVPGHFMCRIGGGAEHIIFDPFEDCKVAEASDLRFIVKQALGRNAELSADYFVPCSNRDILVRLQNNIKLRQIEAEDYAGALETVQGMQAFDPEEYRLCLDAGVLYARNQQPSAAIENLEHYIKCAPSERDRREALLLLEQVRGE